MVQEYRERYVFKRKICHLIIFYKKMKVYIKSDVLTKKDKVNSYEFLAE